MHNFVIRKLSPEHKEELLTICKKIWDGHDYIPYIYDEWLQDNFDGSNKSQFLGVFYENRLIGCGKLSFFNPHYAWLEGLRKDPDANVKGVGKAMLQYYFDTLIKDKEIEFIGFATYLRDRASQSSTEQYGFEKINTYTLKTKELSLEQFIAELNTLNKGGEPENIEYTGNRYLLSLYEHLFNSEYYNRCQGFLPIGWRVYPFTQANLETFFIRKDNYLILDNKNYVFYDFETEDKCIVIKISLVEAENLTNFNKLIKHIFSKAQKRYNLQDTNFYTEVYIETILPNVERIIELFRQTGFVSWDEEQDFFLYHLPLEKLYKYSSSLD